MSANDLKKSGDDLALRKRELDLIAEALRDLRFGSVTIVMQDGVVVQIDRTEKRRLRLSSEP